jgi:hypothetical protein
MSTQKRSSRGGSNKSSDWGSPTPAFNVTKIEIKEGINKKINDIRILLNKISTKNYDAQRDAIFKNISEMFSDSECSEEDKTRVALSVLDIACSNKFYSELYAELYKELMTRFSLFGEILPRVIKTYLDTLKSIHYVDHNEDYDGFCNYTKINDARKSNALFIINLMKKGVLQKTQVINIILELINFVKNYIDAPNRSNETDEITENLYLFIIHSKYELADADEWNNNILTFINDASKLKSKDHVSLTSRAVFKYMDILDDLKKN